MSDILSEVEQVLFDKKVKLAPQEVNLLPKWQSKICTDMMVGIYVGFVAGCAATSQLGPSMQACVAAGMRNYRSFVKYTLIRACAGAVGASFFGLYKLANSVDSCNEHILTLEGSPIQKEFVHLMVKRYGDMPHMQQFLSKRFYSERVFDDSSLDQPKICWRYRNFFSDNIINGQRTRERNSFSNYHGYSPIDYHGDYYSNSQSDSSDIHTHNNPDKRRISSELKKPMNSGIDVMVDPLDCVFGSPATKEEIHRPKTSITSSRMHAQNHKRSHRRRRMRHYDDSLDSEDERH